MNETEKLDDVDGLLTRFFRGSMPQPWPECGAAARSETSAHAGFRALGRLALAASIVLFFLGYLFLSGLFPSPSSSPMNHGRDIGKGFGKTPKVGQVETAPSPR